MRRVRPSMKVVWDVFAILIREWAMYKVSRKKNEDDPRVRVRIRYSE